MVLAELFFLPSFLELSLRLLLSWRFEKSRLGWFQTLFWWVDMGTYKK